MKKKLNFKTVLLVLVVVIVILYLLHKRSSSVSDKEIEQQIANPGSGSTPKATTSQKQSTSSTLGNDTVLKLGTRGREVGWTQFYYNKMIATPKGLPKLKQDNIFGGKTEAAVFSVLGKKSTSWTEWKRTLDAKTAVPVSISTPGTLYTVPIGETTSVVNPYPIKNVTF